MGIAPFINLVTYRISSRGVTHKCGMKYSYLLTYFGTVTAMHPKLFLSGLVPRDDDHQTMTQNQNTKTQETKQVKEKKTTKMMKMTTRLKEQTQKTQQATKTKETKKVLPTEVGQIPMPIN